jgi:hypothetical protein
VWLRNQHIAKHFMVRRLQLMVTLKLRWTNWSTVEMILNWRYLEVTTKKSRRSHPRLDYVVEQIHKDFVINDGEQTMTSKGIKPQDTRDLTWKTPSTREGKTTSASQQQFTMSGVWLQRQRRRLTRRERINLQWKTLTGIYDPYRTWGAAAPRTPQPRPEKRVWPDGPLLPPLRSGPSLPATGLRFAPSEVGLSLGDRIWIITQQTPP